MPTHSPYAIVHHWAQLAADHPMAKIERRRIIGEKAMLSRVVLSPGFQLASHHHDNEQFVVVLSGRCVFGLGREGTPEHRSVEVVGGDVLQLPSNVPHSCRAIEETIILDVFSPVSLGTGVDRR